MDNEHSEANLGDRRPRTRTPRTLRLPGFLPDEPVGLGDVLERATASLGIRHCGGCARRAQVLNDWLKLSRRERASFR